jgi:hypothetical protein
MSANSLEEDEVDPIDFQVLARVTKVSLYKGILDMPESSPL